MSKWDVATERFGLACFKAERPVDDTGDGDGSEFHNSLATAKARAQKLVSGGIYRLVVLWENVGDEWTDLDKFKASEISATFVPSKDKDSEMMESRLDEFQARRERQKEYIIKNTLWPRLTAKGRDKVHEMIREGKTPKEISREVGIGIASVKKYFPTRLRPVRRKDGRMVLRRVRVTN